MTAAVEEVQGNIIVEDECEQWSQLVLTRLRLLCSFYQKFNDQF